MEPKQPSFEDALINKIRDGHGSVYEIMILAHKYGVGIRRINRILKKHIKNNTIIRSENKFLILDNVK